MAEKTKAQLEAEIKKLEAKLAEPADGAIAALKEHAQSLEAELKKAEEARADAESALEMALEESKRTGDVNELMAAAQLKLEDNELMIGALKAKLKEVQGGGAGYDSLARLAQDLEPGTEAHPLEHRVTDDLARIETIAPWFFIEAINFRNDSGYDENARDRAVASVKRAFAPARMGVDKGQYTALPKFAQGNKLVIAVAIVPER